MYNYLIIFFLLTQSVLLLLIFTKFRNLDTKDNDFVISNGIVLALINFYFDMILQDKIDALKLQFDLDPKSKTQSYKAFNDSYNILLANSAKDIMKNYLSKNCLNILLKHYSVDGLALMIISNLKR